MDDKLIKEVLDNSFEKQFSEILLSKSGEVQYSGPGEVRVDGEGNLIFKIFCVGPTPVHEIFSSHGARPGQVIDDSAYYTLNARDFIGDIWTADRIIKNISGGPTGYIVSGEIKELSVRKILNLQISGYSAKIIYPGEIDFPCNTPTVVRTIIAGRERGWSGNRNVAQFNSLGFEFEISKNLGYFSVHLSSDEIPVTRPLIILITETLSFIFSHLLSWSIIEIMERNEQQLYIKYPLSEAERSKIQPPTSFNYLNNINSIWILFDNLLTHLRNMPGESWDTFCYYTHSAIVAGLSNLEVEALTLCAAIEGFLNFAFPEIASSNEQFRQEVQDLRDYLMQSDLSQTLKNRLHGSLSGMLNASAKEKLRELRARELIDNNLITAWDRIRHPIAHGNAPDYIDFQTFLDNRGSIIILFYYLIFLIIGYQGEYCDYSCQGYPIRTFDKVFLNSEIPA